MLRRLSGAVAGGLRRSLSTAASRPRPPWALVQLTSVDESGAPAPGASFHLDAPPFVSNLTVPAYFVHPRPLTDTRTGKYGFLSGQVGAIGNDGFLLVRFREARFDTPAVGADDEDALASPLPGLSFGGMEDINPEGSRFICNPLSGELYRLPDLDGTKRTTMYHHLGLLTQAEGGQGPPARYAVAEMFSLGDGGEEEGGFVMRRFLSETGKWDRLVGLPSPLPTGRQMEIDSAVVPFGDRLWWIDKSWGAISADPLSDRPELCFTELPRGSVLPDLEGMVLMRNLGSYRRMGVSEGKMRYVEVSQEKPYVLSSFSLDEEGSSWTLDHEVPLKDMLAIGAIDPLNANVVYLVCGYQLVGVDMVKGITGSSHLAMPDFPILPCVLPTWLETSQIPYAGCRKETTVKNETSPDNVNKETLRVEIEVMK